VKRTREVGGCARTAPTDTGKLQTLTHCVGETPTAKGACRGFCQGYCWEQTLYLLCVHFCVDNNVGASPVARYHHPRSSESDDYTSSASEETDSTMSDEGVDSDSSNGSPDVMAIQERGPRTINTKMFISPHMFPYIPSSEKLCTVHGLETCPMTRLRRGVGRYIFEESHALQQGELDRKSTVHN
jgi:hypothetical protein